MSSVFVDTSAFLAMLVPSDAHHLAAARTFGRLKEVGAALVTTSYVLVETYALLGRRHGATAVHRFRQGFDPLLEVVWVDHDLHDAGLDYLEAHPRRRLSLVDAVSIEVIGREKVDEVFAYDRHLE